MANFPNNTAPETLGDVSDLLKRQDKDRFNRVHNQDSSKIVALSHVTLEQSGESYRFRSETGKDHEHAEIAVVREASEWLDKMMKDLTEQTEISLTTMATSSPCLECQSVILKMLLDWREKLKLTVNYKLRISYLYHDLESTLTAAPKKRLKDPKVRQNLMAWIQAIKDSGVNFTLEAISVCDELSDHKIRQVKCKSCQQRGSSKTGGAKPLKRIREKSSCSVCESKTLIKKLKREKADSAIAHNVDCVNSSLRHTKWMNIQHQ